jgi:hypothetical protein
MSKLTDAQARHRQAQHVADYCRARLERAAREHHQASEATATADEELEAARAELAEAERTALAS